MTLFVKKKCLFCRQYENGGKHFCRLSPQQLSLSQLGDVWPFCSIHAQLGQRPYQGHCLKSEDTALDDQEQRKRLHLPNLP